MSGHPLNLALRFALELVALGAMGYWGWTQNSGFWRWIAALGLPLIAAAIWGTFRVPGDPKDAPIPVPGVVRLLLEVAFFGIAVVLLALADQSRAAAIFLTVILIHYAASLDRVRWILRQH